MTAIKAVRLASVVTAINVLVARFFDRGDHPSAIPGPGGIHSNAGVVDIGTVRGGAHNSSGFVRIVGDLQAGDACEIGRAHV